jgi:flavin reductase (DIM6/NTAB) family NADH-FMN oxidoreductase RutF
MKRMQISRAFTLMEPGPVVFITTNDGEKNNIMTISWTMVVDFTPVFAITTGPWNYSYTALRKARECVIAIPTVDLIDEVVGVGTCSGADTDKFEKFGLTPVKSPISSGSTISLSSKALLRTSIAQEKRSGPYTQSAMAPSWWMGVS